MIGIFDSGLGGLTVVKEILKQLPAYQLVYFGDTARTPYGNKSAATINQYASEDAEFLISEGAKIIIVACNTASAVAAEALKQRFPKIPIFEVITPAVMSAVGTTPHKRLGVIGTRATIASHIYEEKIKALHNGFSIFSQACPLFVPLAEEGWADLPVTKQVARKYLYPFKAQQIDTLILGCTHYPLLKNVIQQKIGKRVKLIDPAIAVADEVKKYLSNNPAIEQMLTKGNDHRFYFSDVPPHLSGLANKWLGQPIKPLLHNIRS